MLDVDEPGTRAAVKAELARFDALRAKAMVVFAAIVGFTYWIGWVGACEGGKMSVCDDGEWRSRGFLIYCWPRMQSRAAGWSL